MELLLEFRLHVISYLANAMTHSISDFRVGVFTVFDNSIDNRFYFFTSIQILTHLW